MMKAVKKEEPSQAIATTKTEISAATEREKTKSVSTALAEMQATIMLARQFPREEETVAASIQRACTRRSFAEQSFYSYPRGGRNVEGASVNLARELARLWGNIRYGLNVVAETDDARTIEAWAWDVETNTKVSAQDEFKKLIYRKQGGWLKPDERDLRELTNRRGAILVRNCILQLMPKDIVEEALMTSHKTIAGSFQKAKPQEREENVARILKSFSAFGVSVNAIENYFGHPLDNITDTEIAELRGIWNALKDGEPPSSYFTPTATATCPEGELTLKNISSGK